MLEIDGIDVFYSKIQVLWKVSLKVREGEIVAIIGANGAGKTTLLRTIMGILQPTSGNIFFRKNSIANLPTYHVSSLGLSLVPEGRELFLGMSVEENLLLGAHLQRNTIGIRDTLEWMYELFPILKERSQQVASTLSGGEQQMLAIARALMSKPKLLLLDEPSTGLAPIVARKTLETVEKLSDEGVTLMLVEQNVYQSLRMADRGYVLEGGRIIREGSGLDLLDDPSIRIAYLGL
jgi:branched-chain amino acid transport system ATP-binding protein